MAYLIRTVSTFQSASAVTIRVCEYLTIADIKKRSM